jgi:Mrp family chromosome partitioning ATPase
MEAMEKFRPQEPDPHEQRRRQAAENALFRVDVRRSFRMYRRVAIYTAGAVFAVLLLLIAMSRTRYSAECVVSVAPNTQHLMNDGSTPAWGSADSLSYDSFIEQEIQLVHRYDVLAKSIAAPGVKWRGKKESEQSAVDRLAKAMSVSRVEKSYQMAIAVTATSPSQAALLANAVTANFLAASRQDDATANQDRLKALRVERTQLQANLDDKIAQQSAILQRLRIVPGSTTALDTDFASLTAAAAQAKVKHDEALSELRSLDLPGAAAGTKPDDTPYPTPNSLQDKRSALISQMAGLTPNHPVYKEDQAELAQIDQQIAANNTQSHAAALARAQAQARTELATQTALQASLTGQLAAEAAKTSKNTPEIEQSNALATEIARLELRYGAVDDRIRNLELDNGNTSQLQLTSAARPPLQPNPNKRMLFMMLLLPAPLLAGLFAAAIALRVDPKVYSPNDVEAITGYPPFAMLLHQKEASPEVMEEYLLRMAAGVESLHTTRNVRTILVTANASEGGSSSIVTALARKLQEVNRDSAVLDADADESAVTQDDIRALAEKHGLLLVDGPPILSSAKSEYLARFTDAVLLVAESGRTTREELRRAIRLLEKVNAGGVAVVLNKVTLACAEDAVQAEVAELEQRILDRGTTGYTRPALRLFNTSPQEKQLTATPGAAATRTPASKPSKADLPQPTNAFAAPQPAAATVQAVAPPAPVPVSVPLVSVPLVSVPVVSVPVAAAAEPASASRPVFSIGAAPLAAASAASLATAESVAPDFPSSKPEPVALPPAAFAPAQAVAVVAEVIPPAVDPFAPRPAPWAASLSDDVGSPSVPAFAAPAVATQSADAYLPPAEYARPVLKTTEGLFAARAAAWPEPVAAPVTPMQEPVVQTAAVSAAPAPQAPAEEPVELVWKYPTAPVRSVRLTPVETEPAVPEPPQREAVAALPVEILPPAPASAAAVPEVPNYAAAASLSDPVPPKPAAPRLVEEPAPAPTRRMFQFPWKNKRSEEESAAVPAAATDRLDTPDVIEPSMPTLAKPAAYETYIPVPSKAWAQSEGKKQPEKRRSNNPGWMDREEIERQLLGTARRKD